MRLGGWAAGNMIALEGKQHSYLMLCLNLTTLAPRHVCVRKHIFGVVGDLVRVPSFP